MEDSSAFERKNVANGVGFDLVLHKSMNKGTISVLNR